MSVLVVPIDASQILPEAERKTQKIKVAVQAGGKVQSQIVSVEAGRAEAKLEVDPRQTLDIAVGPAAADDQDIFHVQTLTARVTPRQWGDKATFTIPPIILTLWWWRHWHVWCREFVIHGRVVCGDGSAVPGAVVRAYDVDFFWWWASASQVGPSAITDAFGNFTIRFRFCCFWWPWWWWRIHCWRLEPLLVEKLQPIFKLNPALRFRPPDPIPSLDLVAPGPREFGRPKGPVDPSTIEAAREKLLKLLPHVPEFERLRLWPWYPWAPWFDCTPDIIFRVTQSCGETPSYKVVVNENIFQTRWNIPTHLDVTLVANNPACCLHDYPPPPDEDCALLTGVCGDPGYVLTDIGGNSGAPAAPAGYAEPGGRDRPFAEAVSIMGQLGTSALADYYGFEYRPQPTLADPDPAWLPLPEGALQTFWRGYFDAGLVWPHQFQYPAFEAKTKDGKQYYESRHHYEDANPGVWGNPMGRTWFYNVNVLGSIQTANNFSDGVYQFRVVAYQEMVGGGPDVTPEHPALPGCGGDDANNRLVLCLDNRFVAAPTAGSVHVNTTEPDCEITGVRIGANAVAPCGSEQLLAATPLTVDFFVTDPDGHLDHYDLIVRYDVGSYKNLLSAADVGAFTLTAGPGQHPGPDYSDVPAADRPKWGGGTMHLTIDDARNVFPKTCCYVIELKAWKRNITNCHAPGDADDLAYYNETHYSFTVIR